MTSCPASSVGRTVTGVPRVMGSSPMPGTNTPPQCHFSYIKKIAYYLEYEGCRCFGDKTSRLDE